MFHKARGTHLIVTLLRNVPKVFKPTLSKIKVKRMSKSILFTFMYQIKRFYPVITDVLNKSILNCAETEQCAVTEHVILEKTYHNVTFCMTIIL